MTVYVTSGRSESTDPYTTSVDVTDTLGGHGFAHIAQSLAADRRVFRRLRSLWAAANIANP